MIKISRIPVNFESSVKDTLYLQGVCKKHKRSMSVLVCIDSFKYIWIKYFYNEIAYVAHTFNQPVTWSEK